jgi:hypothetical protein
MQWIEMGQAACTGNAYIYYAFISTRTHSNIATHTHNNLDPAATVVAAVVRNALAAVQGGDVALGP